MNNIGNYVQHAKFWDWGGYDRSGEHEYWTNYATEYGKNVLIRRYEKPEKPETMQKPAAVIFRKHSMHQWGLDYMKNKLEDLK